ncbi:MAG TPA: carbohydrate ABC transporter permease [Anaerolineales bacterium]
MAAMAQTSYPIETPTFARKRSPGLLFQLRRWGLEIVFYGVLCMLTIVFALPLVWMLSTSLKPEAQVIELPPQWIPSPILWENYPRMWQSYPFGTFYINSIKIAALNVIGVVFFASLSGYAFARIRFWGRELVFSILLSTLMIPGVVTLIPLYIIFRNIGWIDTHYPLWVPQILSNVTSIFLMRQFFMTLPQELEDAARIDGCSNFGTFWRIMLPQVKPALATIGIFTYLGAWNNFLGPLIFINSLEKQTLPMGLALFQTEFYTSVSLTMAAATIVTAPVIVLFFFAQRYFVTGIALTGVKG